MPPPNRVDEQGTAIADLPTSIAAFIGRAERGPTDVAVRCATHDEFVDAFGGALSASEMAHTVRQYFRNGGRECYIVRLAANNGALTPQHYHGDVARGSGLHALDAVTVFNLLVIPRDEDVSDEMQRDIAAAASRYCRTRRAVLLLDAPRSWSDGVDPGSAALLHGAVVAENVVVYLPDLVLEEDPNVSMGPSGAIAGLIARLDATRGVWKAPAGTEAALEGAPRLTASLDVPALEAANQLGVNTLRVLNGKTLVWGARTLAAQSGSASEWRYLSVRRLGLFLDASIDHGLGWPLLEWNDESLWRRVRESVEAFMNEVWRKGALLGTKPEEAWFVKCGSDTMTQADIERGDLVVLAGFAPLKPAEFIVLRFRQQTAGSAAGHRLARAIDAVYPRDASGVPAFASRTPALASPGAGLASRVSALALRLLGPASRTVASRPPASAFPATVLVLGSADATLRGRAAVASASRLGRRSLRVDLGQVASKYIGETEKNLRRILADAEAADVVLFLDEADALFGRRTAVRDSHDRYALLDWDYLSRLVQGYNVPVLVGVSSSLEIKPKDDSIRIVELDATGDG